MMISTTTADHGLYIPDLSTTPIIATRCRGDVLVDVAADIVFLRRSARRRQVSVIQSSHLYAGQAAVFCTVLPYPVYTTSFI